MKHKHTPGPWAYEASLEGDSDIFLYTTTLVHKNRIGIARVYGEGVLYAGEPKAKANARLIAAAPDMLEALTDLVVMAENGNIQPGPTSNRTTMGQWRASVRDARAIIQKATIQ